MGNVATPDFLIARWNELCRDPSFENLPYRIELNSWGKVEMGPPAGVGHGRQQADLIAQLKEQLPNGVTLVECPVLTEIFSPSNVEAEIAEKTRAYLAAGAEEVWAVAQNGTVHFLDRSGEEPRSRYPVTLNLPDVTHDYL